MTAPLDIRSLASAREGISHPQGGLFPVQVVLSTGEHAAVSRGGAGHLGQTGRLDIVRSRDRGLTWTPPTVIVDSDEDDRNPAFGVLADGTLALAYMWQCSYTAERRYEPGLARSDVRLMRSTDNALSWTAPVDLPQAKGMSPFGRIVTLADGTALMGMYTATGTPDQAPGSYFLRSIDNGASWGNPELIAPGMNETTLLPLPSGEILAALRETDRGHQRLWLARSADGGATWSAPELVTGDMQHPADLVLLDDETILLLYGNRQPPYRVEGKVSRDAGRTWDGRILHLSGNLYGYDIPSPRPTDLGYPSGVLSADGERLVVSYYYNPFPRIQVREWSGVQTTPFYRSDGYLGVTVSVDRAELLAAIS